MTRLVAVDPAIVHTHNEIPTHIRIAFKLAEMCDGKTGIYAASSKTQAGIAMGFNTIAPIDMKILVSNRWIKWRYTFVSAFSIDFIINPEVFRLSRDNSEHVAAWDSFVQEVEKPKKVSAKIISFKDKQINAERQHARSRL